MSSPNTCPVTTFTNTELTRLSGANAPPAIISGKKQSTRAFIEKNGSNKVAALDSSALLTGDRDPASLSAVSTVTIPLDEHRHSDSSTGMYPGFSASRLVGEDSSPHEQTENNEDNDSLKSHSESKDASGSVISSSPSTHKQAEGNASASTNANVSDNERPRSGRNDSIFSSMSSFGALDSTDEIKSVGSQSLNFVPLPLPLNAAMPSDGPKPGDFAMRRRNAVIELDEGWNQEEYHKQLEILEENVRDRNQLQLLLSGNPLFGSLDEDAINTLVSEMLLERRAKGEYLFQEGKESTPILYFVLSGKLKCTRKRKVVRLIRAGDYLGEVGLMYQRDAPTAAVKCITDCVLFALGREHFQSLLFRHCLDRRNRFKPYIDSVPFFSRLSHYNRLRLADALSICQYECGESIMHYGKRCDELFFLIEGRIRVQGRSATGSMVEIRIEEPGGVIGELEFALRRNALGDAIVISPVAKLAHMSKKHCASVLRSVPGSLRWFLSDLTKYDDYMQKCNDPSLAKDMEKLKKLTKSEQEKYASYRRRTLRPQQSTPFISRKESSIPEGSQVNSHAPESAKGVGLYGKKLEAFITTLEEDGEFVMRLPPSLMYYHCLQERSVSSSTAGNLGVAQVSPSSSLHQFTALAQKKSLFTAPLRWTPFIHFSIPPNYDTSRGMVMFTVREDGIIVSWPPKLVQLTGYKPEELVGQLVFDLVGSEKEQAALQHALRSALELDDFSDPVEPIPPPLFIDGILLKEETTSSSQRTPPAPLGKNSSKRAPYHLGRHDGITTMRVELSFVVPQLGNIEDLPGVGSYRVVAVLVTLDRPPAREKSSSNSNTALLLREARAALQKRGVGLQEKFVSLRKIVDSFEAAQRARSVNIDGWRPVNLRQLVGKVVMDCKRDCGSNNHLIEEVFEKLSNDDAWVDTVRLPRVLKHTLRLITDWSPQSDVKVTVSTQKHTSANFLVFAFSCVSTHMSPALLELQKEIERHVGKFVRSNSVTSTSVVSDHHRAQGSKLEMSMQMSSYNELGNSFSDQFSDRLDVFSFDDTRRTMTSFSPMMPHHMLNSKDQSTMNYFPPRFRNHLRGIRHAVEQQGGTVRCSLEQNVFHLMYMLPYIPEEEKSTLLSETPSPHHRRSSLTNSPFAAPPPPPPPGSSFSPLRLASGTEMGNGSPESCEVSRDRLAAHVVPFLRPRGIALQPGLTYTPHEIVSSEYQTPDDLAGTSRSKDIYDGIQHSSAQSHSPIVFTTLVAEQQTLKSNLLCKYLWERKHTVLSAKTLNDLHRLVEKADILIVDVMQFMALSGETIHFLQEKNHHIAVIVTGTMDRFARDAYTGAGFLVMPQPVQRGYFRVIMDQAELRMSNIKREASSIVTIRNVLKNHQMTSWDRGEVLGKGAHGVVYVATSCTTGAVMAVKEMVVSESTGHLEDLLTEISTMCCLQHPNIIHYLSCELSSQASQLHNAESTVVTAESLDSSARPRCNSILNPVDNSPLYLRVFMEYASGGSLQKYLSETTSLSFGVFQSLLRDVVAGLAYIHSNQYLHGDIKTANILLTDSNVAKIGDFGNARRLNPDELLYSMEGSLSYMSPECLSAGEVDESGVKIGFGFPSDVWSLGVVAMEMITNKPPYSHVKSVSSPASLTQYLTTLKTTPDLSPLFQFPAAVTEFIAACLQVNPAHRATAQQLLHFSLLHDNAEGDAMSANKAFRQAELLHALENFEAFKEPEAERLEIPSAFQRIVTMEDNDDFFNSDTTGSDDNDSELDENLEPETEGTVEYLNEIPAPANLGQHGLASVEIASKVPFQPTPPPPPPHPSSNFPLPYTIPQSNLNTSPRDEPFYNPNGMSSLGGDTLGATSRSLLPSDSGAGGGLSDRRNKIRSSFVAHLQNHLRPKGVAIGEGMNTIEDAADELFTSFAVNSPLKNAHGAPLLSSHRRSPSISLSMLPPPLLANRRVTLHSIVTAVNKKNLPPNVRN